MSVPASGIASVRIVQLLWVELLDRRLVLRVWDIFRCIYIVNRGQCVPKA
jgi:hypothetical protein